MVSFHHIVQITDNSFYPRDVVSGVLATATCLAGCPSHAGIVSKRLNLGLSENFLDLRRYTNPTGTPSGEALNTQRELTIFVRFHDVYRRLSR